MLRSLRRTTRAFTSLVRPDLAAALARQSITSPTSIQREALPLAMGGADVLVNASTGSGKTLIFLLPLLQRLLEQPASSIDLHATAECLVLVPTAELAQQVRDVAAALAPEPVNAARLLIATPELWLGLRRPAPAAVAIDEADAILCAADGVARDAGAILHSLLPVDGAPPPQVLLTTATLRDAHAARLAAAFPAAHSLSHAGALARTLQQTFQYVPRESDKTARLLDLLDAAAAEPWLADAGAATMVFCSGDDEAEAVHARLAAHAAETGAPPPALLSGGASADARAAALRGVAAGDTSLLVCTDLAARGIDLPSVRHVVMYDLPRDATGFIHRAGRTARVGAAGRVSCLVQEHEIDLYRQLYEGEALPGTALGLSSGRQVAPAAARAPPAKNYGWVSRADSAHALAERSMAVDSRRVEGGAAAVPSPIPGGAAMGAEFGWADPHRCIPRVPETEPKRRKPRTAAEIHQGLVD